MNNLLEPVDNGSNYPFRDKLLQARQGRSGFNWSHNRVFTLENAGLLLPVFLAETLPNSDYDINADLLLRVLPQVVPLYSDQKYYMYAFYARYSDLWSSAQTYMTKGFSGNEILKKPVLSASNVGLAGGMEYVVKPDDIFDCFGFQKGKKLSEFGEINALPFMMYEKIYTDYFMNNNLHINDRVRLPNDPSDFRLADDGTVISNKNATEDYPAIKLCNLHYRDYSSDYFLTALPFQQRGDAPTLTLSSSSGDLNATSFSIGSLAAQTARLGFDGSFSQPGNHPLKGHFTNDGVSLQDGYLFSNSNKNLITTGSVSETSDLLGISATNTPGFPGGGFGAQTISGSNLTLKNAYGSISGSFTLDQFRNLAVATAELERMARTDGTFAQFGITFFGEKSRNSNDFYVTFVGGSYRSIAFSEVLQMSSSVNNSPLGSYAGHGMISDNGYLGHLHSDEHGYLMILLSVMPDVYYSQGLPKMFSRLTQAEEFLPDRDKLGLTAIFNKELYVSGNKDTDNDVFAYQNPFDEYRYKENVISGKIADSTNRSFFPYTQARLFNSTPTYSESFFRADDVRKDYLASPTEDAYSGRIRFDIRAVEPLSFTGNPSPVI